MPINIDADASMVYAVHAMGMTFYCEKRDLTTDVEIIQMGGGAALPVARKILTVAWISSVRYIEDVTISGDYIAHPDVPSWWNKRTKPEPAAKPVSNIFKM